MKYFNKEVWISKKSPLETYILNLPFLCKCWTSTKFAWWELMEALKLYSNMKIYHSNKKRLRKWFKQEKNGTPFLWVEFWLVWRYHVISCFHFCFLFRTNCKKDHSDENYFPHCYGNFFELEKLQGTLTSAYLAAENFTDMDELMCQFFLG